jgi:hypothetical protein
MNGAVDKERRKIKEVPWAVWASGATIAIVLIGALVINGERLAASETTQKQHTEQIREIRLNLADLRADLSKTVASGAAVDERTIAIQKSIEQTQRLLELILRQLTPARSPI